MKDAFQNIPFQVQGTPKDPEGAKELARQDKYQFQGWVCSLVNARPYLKARKKSQTAVLMG